MNDTPGLKLLLKHYEEPTEHWLVAIGLALPSSPESYLSRPLFTTPSREEADRALEELGFATDPWRAVAKALLLQPGLLVADLLSQERDGGDSEEEREAAVERLTREHFRRGDIFHESRWTSQGGHLPDAFRDWRGDRHFKEAWADLATGYILDAFAATDDTTEVGDVYQRVRSAVRSAIERELLGRTLDAGDPTTKLAKEPTVSTDELLDQAFERTDLLAALATLHPDERQLLLEYYDPESDRDAIAARLRISNAALRKRVSRLTQELVL